MPKISEMTVETHMDEFCDLVVNIDSILSNKEVMQVMEKIFANKEHTMLDAIRLLWVSKSKLITVMLKEEKESMLNIISILNDESIEDLNKLKIMELVVKCKDTFMDKELISFFKSQIVSKTETN